MQCPIWTKLHIFGKIPGLKTSKGQYPDVTIAPPVEALTPWRNPDLFSRGVSLGSVASGVVLTTDASTHGWGAVCEGMPALGLWSEPQSRWHINHLELEVVCLALNEFGRN